jgi:hypothetical protein
VPLHSQQQTAKGNQLEKELTTENFPSYLIRWGRSPHCDSNQITPRLWRYEQILVDPEELNDWSLDLQINLDRSDAESKPILHLTNLAPII